MLWRPGLSSEPPPDTFAAPGHADLIHAAGGGIFGHPGGIAEGVTAFRQAWDAAMAGTPLAQHARAHRELATALEFWTSRGCASASPSIARRSGTWTTS